MFPSNKIFYKRFSCESSLVFLTFVSHYNARIRVGSFGTIASPIAMERSYWLILVIGSLTASVG